METQPFMNPVILFRKDLSNLQEIESANKYFPTYENRSAIPANSLVIGRYSVLPYYKELELDLQTNNSKLINSYEQHNFLADIKEWYPCLGVLTPQTWFNVMDIPPSYEGPFVVKGATNSRKHDWNKKMFAPDRKSLGQIIANLAEDSLISEQGIIIREYKPLVNILIGLNGLPITKEFRIFVLKRKILGYGFYWSSYVEDVQSILGEIPSISYRDMADDLIHEAIDKISNNYITPNFYVIDIALTKKGDWIVIELNDAQMSGLSEVNVDRLYENLKYYLQ